MDVGRAPSPQHALGGPAPGAPSEHLFLHLLTAHSPFLLCSVQLGPPVLADSELLVTAASFCLGGSEPPGFHHVLTLQAELPNSVPGSQEKNSDGSTCVSCQLDVIGPWPA